MNRSWLGRCLPSLSLFRRGAGSPGKKSYNWLPFRCLENQADAELLYTYVTDRIAASKQSDPVGGRPETP
ncbi:MAG: hypothetical protein ACK557_00325, partial [Planctomycetota bacterium]